MSVPGQRKPGQTGGHGGQRKNKGTFRKSGGNVPPPRKQGTSPMVVAGVGVPVLATVLYWLVRS